MRGAWWTGLSVVVAVWLALGSAPARAAAQGAPGTSGPGDFESISSRHVKITYRGVPAAYATAILTVAETARDVYANTFQCQMPDMLEVNLAASPSEQTSLWTDGESRLFLTVSSVRDLAPPRQSGVFNIYGICHELGHIALYRRIQTAGLPAGLGEGWAHYAGSVVTDQVYAKHGKKLWPVPYDYRADGLARLRKQVEEGEAGEDASMKVAAAFYGAHQRYGARSVFAAMNEATRGRPEAQKVMPQFIEALIKVTGDKYCRDLFPEEAVAPKMQWYTAERQITDQTVEGMVTVEDATGVLLKYDREHSDGMLSTAGAGHAVVFKRPAGRWAVDAVEMYGSRYGTPQPPKENFTIYICDQDFNIVKEVAEPYSKLAYGEEAKWHRFDFPPVEVPEGFYVCIFFNPTYTKGFYMHYEEGHAKSHSRSALPSSFVEEVDYDWMIRAHLRPLP